MTDAFLSTARAMDRGTREARIGKAIGEMLGGFYLTAGGVTGEILGTGLTTTGIGSVLGVPAMVVSAGLVTSGAANMAFGLRRLSEALMSSGSGGGEQAARGAARLHDLSHAASASDKAGLTKAGRALQKHGDRAGSAFPQTTGGPARLNPAGQDVVDDILTIPGSIQKPNRFNGVDVIAPDGRGVRYDGNGKMMGFLEP